MNPVTPGQVWSLRSVRSMLYEFTVTAVEPPNVVGLVNGKSRTMNLSVLQHGRRSAHLVRDAGGVIVPKPKKKVNRPCPPARRRALGKMLSEGWTSERIGRFFGVNASTVDRWLLDIRKNATASRPAATTPASPTS